MHELLAPIVYLISKELESPPSITDIEAIPEISVTLESFDSHCFALFSLLMDYCEIWYEHTTWSFVDSNTEKVMINSVCHIVFTNVCRPH
jgi:hypothetical protein